MKTYYEMLGLSQSASPEEIKKAYRHLARRHHPDVNQGDKDAEARFKLILEAYQVLSDETAKKGYDERLQREAQGRSGPAKQPSAASARAKASGAQGTANMDKLNEHFAKFFGFEAAGSGGMNKSSAKEKSNKGPLNTTGLFENYFGIKKK